ncbi:MAG: hypothetical protein JNJ69_15800 [Leptospiraceae bacterium]|nr:hypothetical protein [Leptospiraceae bacterium]
MVSFFRRVFYNLTLGKLHFLIEFTVGGSKVPAMRFWYFFVCVPLLSVTGVFAAEPKKDKAAELARVAIMTFINASDSAHHEWVEKSLPDAINDSMQARFEFVRQDENKVRAVADKLKHVGGEYSQVDADKIAKESQSDILIYGSFKLSESKEDLLLKAVIYNAQGKRVIGVVEDTSPADAKIFKSIDRMAAGIVEKIYSFALAAEREQGKKVDLKILVLVPTYSTADEEKKAVKELDVLKNDLADSYLGRYLTIYEFYSEYKVTKDEQAKANGFAKNRERNKIISWLEGYGVRNAFIVLVSDKKVNITPVAEGKAATQISYAVNARPEEKKAGIAKASLEMAPKGEKVELKKNTLTSNSVTLLHIGALGGKGVLEAGNNLGVLTGLNVQFGMKIWKPWLQPQVKLEGYYVTQKEPVTYLLGGSLSGGFGYTILLGQRMALTPYVMGGAIMGVIKNTATSITFYLPSVSAGLTYTVFLGPRWGISFNPHVQYVIDKIAPGIFFTGSVSWVYRF